MWIHRFCRRGAEAGPVMQRISRRWASAGDGMERCVVRDVLLFLFGFD